MIKNVPDDIVGKIHHEEVNHQYLDQYHRTSMKNEPTTTADDQSPMRSMAGKKKKVIGAGRNRLPGDSLPPLAPSSSASRREDITQSKGPPVGTPRPQAVVAQWAITSPTPHSTAEKLTTINSDNELDNDEEGYKSLKASKRIVSPHPRTTNRIINEKKKNQFTMNNNDDEEDSPSRRSLSMRKSRSKLSDDDENDSEDRRKKTNSTERDRHSRQRYDRNDDDNDDDEKISSRRIPTSTGDSSRRSHSRTNGKIDDDLR